jgi:hypothetical protein
VNRGPKEGCAAIVSSKGSKEDIEAVANPPTGTLTFLFTDIEGSTKLWEDNAPAMQVALARHDELLRWAITERGCYVFKTVGDAFCFVFSTAPDALEAALEIQRKLLSSEWEDKGILRVRMALHTGAGWRLLRPSSKQGCEAALCCPRRAGTRSASCGDESKGPGRASPQGPLPSREGLPAPRS